MNHFFPFTSYTGVLELGLHFTAPKKLTFYYYYYLLSTCENNYTVFQKK